MCMKKLQKNKNNCQVEIVTKISSRIIEVLLKGN